MIHAIALTGSSIVVGILLVGILFSLEAMIK
jgi:hypothetical protein